MRTGPPVVVQHGDFVIASGCRPLDNLIRCGFANELFADKPRKFHGRPTSAFARNGIVFFETRKISLLFGDTIVDFCPTRLANSLSVSGRKRRRSSGECCAAARGPQVIVSKCNPLTEM
jgi:hypothetical protein